MNRADIEFRIGCSYLLIDVVVVLPTAKKHIGKAMEPLGAAESAAIGKTRKHGEAAILKGAEFIPYIVEAFGGLGHMARSFNKFLANYGARNNVAFSSQELMQEIYADVTVALHE